MGEVRLDRLAARIGAELERWKVPAIELAAVAGDEVVLADAFGARDVERNLPATAQTVFHHGSTGKAFTGLLAAMLVDEGLLAWDTPVREYLPEFRLPDPVATERITVLDVLSHRSGMARHDLAWILNPSWSREELVRRLRHLEVARDLRVEFGYSNFGFIVAGAVIGAVTGSSWEEQVHKRVFEPLGMSGTVTSVADAQARADHARPYAVRGGAVVGLAYRRSDPIAPAGQVISPAVDSARWLLFQAGGGVIGGDRLVSEPAFAHTRTAHIPFPAVPLPELELTGYGLGWALGTYRGEPMIWHSGGIDGFTTQVIVLPSRRIGVLASVNAHLNDLPQAAMLHVLDRLLGRDDEDWFARQFAAADEAAAAVAAAAGAGRRVAGTAPSHALREYVGAYEHPGYGALVVSAEGDGGLSFRLGDSALEGRHRHYDTWDLRYAALDSDWPVSFVADPDGYIVEAVIPLEDAVAPIRFTRSGTGGEDR